MPRRAMDTEVQNTSALQRQARWLEDYRPVLRVSEQGRVLSVGDGIAWIDGLPTAAMDEVLELEDGSRALVFHLKSERLGAILLYQTERLTAGTRVALTGRRLELPVGDALLGRVVDPLGMPLDGRAPPRCDRWRPLDATAPPIVDRTFVNRPLYTGSKIIDTMIPIGKGQRQLLIGDNGLGKSALAIDTVINQRGKNVKCVYVLVGQKRSTVVNTIDVSARAWRSGAYGGGGGRGNCAPRPEVPGAVRRLRRGGELDAVRRGYPGRVRRHHHARADVPRAVAAAAAAAGPRGLSRRHLLSAFAPVGARDLPGADGRRR